MKTITKFAITLFSAALFLGGGTVLEAQQQSQPATKEVVVTGVGLDPDKALKNALMNAVEQVVGLILDTETQVKNEAIVKERILTHSDGFVETFQKLKALKRDDGLFEVKISAVVKRRQLLEKLEESKVSGTKIDGTSLFGEVVTQHEANKTGVELLKQALQGTPVNLLRARVLSSKPMILNTTDSSVKALWNIEIKFPWDDYETKMLPPLKQALGAAAIRQGSSEISEEGRFGEGRWNGTEADGHVFTPSTRSPFWHAGSAPPSLLQDAHLDAAKELMILLNVGRSKNLQIRRWKWYIMDLSTTGPVLKPSFSQRLKLRVSILDAAGEVVRQNDIPLNAAEFEFLQSDFSGPGKPKLYKVKETTMRDWFIGMAGGGEFPFGSSTRGGYNYYVGPGGKPWHIVEIAPYIRIGSSVIYGDTLELPFMVELSLDELKRMSEIQCSVILSPQSSN